MSKCGVSYDVALALGDLAVPLNDLMCDPAWRDEYKVLSVLKGGTVALDLALLLQQQREQPLPRDNKHL